MNLKYLSYIPLFLILFLTGCMDEIFYMNSDDDIPDGVGNLSAEVVFTPSKVARLGGTRAAGGVLTHINSLCVLIYNHDGTLYRKCYGSDLDGIVYTKNEVTSPDAIAGNGESQSETETPKAKFTIKNVAFGKYYIYAVANMEDLAGYDVSTVEKLQNIQLNWNSEYIENNDQMFGYFTLSSNMESKGFDGHLITVRKGVESIHAWIKRAASKVTIAYDPSGLNQDVFIYIKNVTIHDIPATCPLGAVNKPKQADLLNGPGANPVLPNTQIVYPNDGVLSMAATDPNCTGLELAKAYPIKGAADHLENDDALFFYENMQGDYDGQSRYDKQQQLPGKPDGVGENVREPKDDNDYKDRVLDGTYIEVDAYYISQNKNNVSEGPIKYRFMLGKDVRYNYDAQRNYHFKLTLGFRGWANQPDWHIDYEEPDPGMELPLVFRISYLYNQKAMLPIKLLGNFSKVEMSIVENNWAPFDEKTNSVPSATVLSTPADYEFKWAKDVYDGGMDGVSCKYLGFLALQVPESNIPTNVCEEYDYREGMVAQDALNAYYTSNHQDERTFSDSQLDLGAHPAGNNSWEVIKNYDANGKEIAGQKTLLVPLWTRNKNMIFGSGFSGNNPYEYYSRKARVRIVGTYKLAGETYTTTKEVVVLQVPRIVNPKGVWRSHDDDTGDFHVVLKVTETSNDRSNFVNVISEGSWCAYVEAPQSGACVSLAKSPTTIGEVRNDSIIGDTGSIIDFLIKFGPGNASESRCAIVTVKYHGDQCIHKILVRQGYNNPITMGGKDWSSFSVYSNTYSNELSGGNDGYDDVYETVLTNNPLALGSLFRRGRQSRAILTSNADRPNFGAMQYPNQGAFNVVYQNQSTTSTWAQIGYRTGDVGNPNIGLGTFYAETNGTRYKYKVPTLADFQAMAEEAEFAFGIIYGNGADETQDNFETATGLIDGSNSGAPSKMGVRGVIAYNPNTGNQLLFPIGKAGMARRRQFNVGGSGTTQLNRRGTLWYADVNTVLSQSANANNKWRPIPYNLTIVPGGIYWIDSWVAQAKRVPIVNPTDTGWEASLGWDINYFSFDFNPYSANNEADACPIKLIVVND